jgi:hypothetical protein
MILMTAPAESGVGGACGGPGGPDGGWLMLIVVLFDREFGEEELDQGRRGRGRCLSVVSER